MKRLALLLCLLVAACNGTVPEASPPGPTIYRQANGGGLLACTPVGFDTFFRGG